MADSDLMQLYSRRILALTTAIPHQGKLRQPDASAMRRSPQCGSSVTVHVVVSDGRIADFAQEVRACALGQASASVLPTAVSDTVEAIRRASGETELQPAVIAHPAYGKVHVSWFHEDVAVSDDVAARVLRDTRDAVHDLGGSLLIERCPPPIKGRLDVWDEVGESLSVMRRMKRQYDPKRILNPGRFVGGI